MGFRALGWLSVWGLWFRAHVGFRAEGGLWLLAHPRL